MIEATIPAFREDGQLITLAEVLDCVGDSPWRWRLVYFEGIPRPGSELDVTDLGRSVDESVQGLDYSWPDLVALAQEVFQAIEATIVAFDRMGRNALVLEVRDSTYWRILADEGDPAAVAALKRIAQLK